MDKKAMKRKISKSIDRVLKKRLSKKWRRIKYRQAKKFQKKQIAELDIILDYFKSIEEKDS